jgi:proline iminopeptidase
MRDMQPAQCFDRRGKWLRNADSREIISQTHMMMLLALPLLAATLQTADGIRLWYSDAGKGAPIVVIHGGPGMDHGSLENDLAPLTKRHRVIFYDQRGGGRSSLPDDAAQLTIDHHVSDLEALRKHLRIEKMTLLAHSFGPAIAALYAIRYPDHVDRMIFLGPIPRRKGAFFEEYGANLSARVDEKSRMRAEEIEKSFATTKDMTAACREYWSIMTPPRVARSLSATLVKSDLCSSPPEAIRFGMLKTGPATWQSMGEWDWTADLQKLRTPLLIIHGEEDAIPMKMVEEWSNAMPNARLMKLEKTAHFPHAERPDIVFPAIEKFLKEDSWTPKK